MHYIDLKPAFTWVCPKCGKRHFTESTGGELDVEHARDLGLNRPVDFRLQAVADYADGEHEFAEALVRAVAIGPHLVRCDCGGSWLTQIAADKSPADDDGEDEE